MVQDLSAPEFQPRRIALIKPSALGDILNSLPVLTNLRQRFPCAHITWIVNRAYEPLLRGHPDLDETLAFDRHAVRNSWGLGALHFVTFLRTLRERRFDLAIDLQGLFRSGLMACATGAQHRIGLSSAREGAKWFYTRLVEDGGRTEVHAVDRVWKVVEALGGSGPKVFHLPVDAGQRAWAKEALRALPRPWLAVAVGARWITKRWPPEHFADLVRQAQQHFGGTAIFVGAPEDQPLVERAGSLVPGPILDLTGRTTLPQLTALLAEADAMLSNDTGPLHLAVALGRPVVAPYTCTTVRRNGPYGQEARAVTTAIWCAGSYLRTCARLECMADLTPARIWPVLREVLSSCMIERQSA